MLPPDFAATNDFGFRLKFVTTGTCGATETITEELLLEVSVSSAVVVTPAVLVSGPAAVGCTTMAAVGVGLDDGADAELELRVGAREGAVLTHRRIRRVLLPDDVGVVPGGNAGKSGRRRRRQTEVIVSVDRNPRRLRKGVELVGVHLA